MESKTQFDLNRNLELWRQSLAQSPSFQPDNLDELEVHLRDSVSTLEGKGLSTEEAFHIAAHRLGQPTALHKEFGKVNAETVWLSRWLWMSVGIFLFRCIHIFRGIADECLVGLAKHFTFNPHVLRLLSLAATLATLTAIFVFLRRLAAPSMNPRNRFIAKTILNRPLVSLVGLVLFSMSMLALAFGIKGAWGRMDQTITPETTNQVQIVLSWTMLPLYFAELILLPTAIVYFYRRQFKARCAHA